MKKIDLYIVALLFPLIQFAQNPSESPGNNVISRVDSTQANNMVLIQTFEVNATLNQVWDAYTTKRGWENWAVAVAEIDFRIGGLIQTRYDKNAKIGDKGTIKLHIINYVPKKMITLQAELTENFPEFMKADSENMYNTIYFEELSPSRTKVISYGIGYKNNTKYKSLLGFFIKGNEKLYQNLITYLETGEPSVKY